MAPTPARQAAHAGCVSRERGGRRASEGGERRAASGRPRLALPSHSPTTEPASDIALYHEEKLRSVRASGTLALLSEEIAEGRELYDSHVEPALRGLFDSAIKDILLAGVPGSHDVPRGSQSDRDSDGGASEQAPGLGRSPALAAIADSGLHGAERSEEDRRAAARAEPVKPPVGLIALLVLLMGAIVAYLLHQR